MPAYTIPGPKGHRKVTIQTTIPAFPFPANTLRSPPTITSPSGRLLLRWPRASDLRGYHTLRTDPAVMEYTATGRPDRDLVETWDRLSSSLSVDDGRMVLPHDATPDEIAACEGREPRIPDGGAERTYNMCIYLNNGNPQDQEKNDDDKLEFVGAGGMHHFDRTAFMGPPPSPETESGPRGRIEKIRKWPELGYMFRQAHWGQGYGTEFVSRFLDQWWSLPRETVRFELDEAAEIVNNDNAPGEYLEEILGYLSLVPPVPLKEEEKDEKNGENPVLVIPEHLFAFVSDNNPGSSKILGRLGFREVRRWSELDPREGRAGDECTLISYLLTAPPQTQTQTQK